MKHNRKYDPIMLNDVAMIFLFCQFQEIPYYIRHKTRANYIHIYFYVIDQFNI